MPTTVGGYQSTAELLYQPLSSTDMHVQREGESIEYAPAKLSGSKFADQDRLGDGMHVLLGDSETQAMWRGMMLMIVSSLFAGLGNSMVPVSILSFLHIVTLMLAVECMFRSVSLLSTRSLFLFTFTLITQSLGFCLGFYSLFGYPKNTAESVMASIGAGVLCWVLTIIIALIPHLMFTRLFPQKAMGVLVFPTLLTVVSCTVVGRVFGTMISIGNSALDYEPLRQVSSLLGIHGVCFLFVLCASAPVLFLVHGHRLSSQSRVRWCFGLVGSLLVVFTITGFLHQSPYLLQKNVSRVIAPTIPVSCLFSQYAEVNSTAWDVLWVNTEQRIVAGDAIVLMSEEAVKIVTAAEEQYLIALALRTVSVTPLSAGALLGVTYLYYEHPHDRMAWNRFLLVSMYPQQSTSASVEWLYDKAHPVPLVESDILAGDESIPMAHTPYGLIAGAICFDLDFPQYIAQTGRAGVDLLLQPSWTWNAINFRHFDGDALRAVENGMSLFRCSSDGESGIVDAYGKFLHRQETGHDPNVIAQFSIPTASHVVTVFPFVGFVFEYVLLCAGAGMIVLCWWSSWKGSRPTQRQDTDGPA